MHAASERPRLLDPPSPSGSSPRDFPTSSAGGRRPRRALDASIRRGCTTEGGLFARVRTYSTWTYVYVRDQEWAAPAPLESAPPSPEFPRRPSSSRDGRRRRVEPVVRSWSPSNLYGLCPASPGSRARDGKNRVVQRKSSWSPPGVSLPVTIWTQPGHPQTIVGRRPNWLFAGHGTVRYRRSLWDRIPGALPSALRSRKVGRAISPLAYQLAKRQLLT